MGHVGKEEQSVNQNAVYPFVQDATISFVLDDSEKKGKIIIICQQQ